MRRFAIAAILALGAIGLFAFPLIGHALALSDHAYGLWAGLAIDNTAEATAAGNLWSEQAGKIAVLAKTTRNATIGFVVLAYAIYWAAKGEAQTIDNKAAFLWNKFPKFVLGFIVVSLAATLGVFSKEQAERHREPVALGVSVHLRGRRPLDRLPRDAQAGPLSVHRRRGRRSRHRDPDARHRDRGATLAAGLGASIMSPIPKTAPFAEDEIEILNRVVGPATAIQRAWLAGFLAGLDAQSGAAAGAVTPAAAPQPAEPLTILYATESGNSEKLAGDVAKAARKSGFKPSLVDMADLDARITAGREAAVVIAATWGEGEPPGPRDARLRGTDERCGAAARRRRIRRAGARRHRLCRVLRHRQGARRAARGARRQARRRPRRLRPRFRRRPPRHGSTARSRLCAAGSERRTTR